MNILGFVSMFLLMIAFLITTFEVKTGHFLKEKKSYDQYLSAAQKVRNNYEQKKYESIKPRKPSEQNASHQATETKRHPRKTSNMPLCARLNISPLFAEENPEMRPFFLSLLNALYQNRFDSLPKNFEEKLLTKIIAAAKEMKEPHLAKFHLKDPDLQYFYYHMLKGTPNFDEEKGIPSLLDYIHMEKEKNEKICLPCADFEMLKALFGKKIAIEIESEREKPYHRLEITEDKLNKLLSKHNQVLPLHIRNLLKFSHKRESKEWITVQGTDNNKNITLKNEFPMQKIKFEENFQPPEE